MTCAGSYITGEAAPNGGSRAALASRSVMSAAIISLAGCGRWLVCSASFLSRCCRPERPRSPRAWACWPARTAGWSRCTGWPPSPGMPPAVRPRPPAVRPARAAGSPPVLLHRAVAPGSRAWRRPAPPGRSATPGARRRPASRQLHHRASFHGFSCIQPNSGAGTCPAAPARSPGAAPLHLEPGHLVNATAASAAEANNCRRADLAVIHPRCCHSRPASESPAITTSPNGIER